MSPGTWTPGGSPATVADDSDYLSFPGLARLDAGRVIVVYRHGADHLTGGNIVAKIGTLSGVSVSWGTEFTIYDHPTYDLRLDDAVSVVDGYVTIAGRHYNGSASFIPFLILSDVRARYVTSSTTWNTTNYITFAQGSTHNLPSGHVIKLGADSYLLPVYHNTGALTFKAGVLLNDSLTDWSSPTYVAVTGNGYTEICVIRGPFGLYAFLRQEANLDVYRSISTDDGVTWSSPAFAFDGYGWPKVTRLSDGTLLAVVRDPPHGDNEWYTSANDGTTWSNVTTLDTTGEVGVYAAILQLDVSHALVVYGVEYLTDTEADLFSQVFTRT